MSAKQHYCWKQLIRLHKLYDWLGSVFSSLLYISLPAFKSFGLSLILKEKKEREQVPPAIYVEVIPLDQVSQRQQPWFPSKSL